MAFSASKESAILFRRIFFFVVLIALTILYLVLDFRGLSTPRGMELAQMSRETARGNFMETKMVRGKSFAKAEAAAEGESPDIGNFKNTYHGPLFPAVQGAIMWVIGADDTEKWAIKNNENVFALDQVVAGFATICFLLAIAAAYVLAGRLFDSKIAGVTALLMLLCNLLWQFTSTGLQHTFMLLLMMVALLFIQRAVEKAAEGEQHLIPAVLGGVCLILMALTHYLALWILFAYIIYAAIVFRPRALVGVILILLSGGAFIFPVLHNLEHADGVLGTGYLAIYGGIGGAIEDATMRSTSLTAAPIDTARLFRDVFASGVSQTSHMYLMMGSIVAAPFFFIALLHPFRRAAIAKFRWAVLALWIGAAVGMSIYGVEDGEGIHTNQLHILFMPAMAAYGLAFISIVWSRLDEVKKVPLLKNAHFAIIVLISAAPMLIPIIDKTRIAVEVGKTGRTVSFTYQPALLSKNLRTWVGEDEIVVSDQPWAVAWYADRKSIWLPEDYSQLLELDKKVAERDHSIIGLHVSRYTTADSSLLDVVTAYNGFDGLILDGLATYAANKPGSKPSRINNGPGNSYLSYDVGLEALAKTYRHRADIGGRGLMMYYSKKPVGKND